MLSGGYGKYENWGLRVAVSVTPNSNPPCSQLTLHLGNAVTMVLLYIQPGTFIMGGESTTDGRFHCVELPRHQVEITKGFYLGKYPVTQAQYQAAMGHNPSRSTKNPDCPVDNIGASEATSFCDKITQNTGFQVRLPTEAEWEFASRGGRSTKWFFGDDSLPFGDYAWFRDNSCARSHPVGLKKPNPFGLHDIYGNVCERVSDTYSREYYSIGPTRDPTGPHQGTASSFQFRPNLAQSGKYLLVATVVTANYDQRLDLVVNRADSAIVVDLPFTAGRWKDSDPVPLTLNAGVNVLQFSRSSPPQYGVAVKKFSLSLVCDHDACVHCSP